MLNSMVRYKRPTGPVKLFVNGGLSLGYVQMEATARRKTFIRPTELKSIRKLMKPEHSTDP
jgi:hypothetical protein